MSVQGPKVELTHSPSSSSCLPHSQAARPQPQGEEKDACDKPPQAALTPKEGQAPATGCGSSRGSGSRAPGPTLIRQTACRRLSPGSSFSGHCQVGGLGAPRWRGWRGWANDRPLWHVLPGTCRILERQEGGWGWALRPELGKGGQGQGLLPSLVTPLGSSTSFP